MGRHSISLVIFCMVFGFLIGLAGFLGMAFLGGFVEAPEAEAVSTEPSYSTGTERLEAYRCRGDETKVIIMGGVEDDFDPAGDEIFEPLPELVAHVERFMDPQKGAEPGQVLYTTKYDDPTQNRYFLDRFDIPQRTFHGIVATRLKDGSSVKNDSFSIGYDYDMKFSSINPNSYYENASNLVRNGAWSQEDAYIWTDLNRLKLPLVEVNDNGGNLFKGYSRENLLDAIRRNDGSNLHVLVVDDTMVDFIGFALCLEPAEDMGTVFDRHHYSGIENTFSAGEGFVSLFSKATLEGGRVSCDERRPLPCIHDQNLPRPDVFDRYSVGLWSGGEIKFTEPVQGGLFKTEDDVDAYCAAEFGSEWRAVNSKDGNWQGAIYGYGEFPDGYEDFWITYKDAPHHNCWALRQDYDDLARLEQD